MALAGPAAAQAEVADRTVQFAIPAGDLASSLLQLSEAAGLDMVLNPALVDGETAPALSGAMTARDGLDRLLAGTSLYYAITAGGRIVLRRAAGPPASAASGPQANRANAVRLQGVTVTETAIEPEETYAPAPSSIATKLNLPLRRTPFTINQATEELIDERADINIFETLENFAGVTTTSTNADIGQGISRSINVRGFELGGAGQTLINGQRAYGLGSQNRAADNLERVELLRGPAALYYGAAQPGGVVNYVYKRPKDFARYQVQANTDSQGSYGGSIDLTGPITEDGTLLYRAVGNYSRYEDDQNHIFSNPVSALAALTWKPSEAFSTTFTYEYYDFESVPEQENNKLDSETGEFFPIPRDFYWGNLDDRAVRTTHTFIWDAEWKPSETLKVNAYANFQRSDQWYQNTRIVGGGRGGTPTTADENGNVPRYVSMGRNSSPETEIENLSVGLDISGEFDTFGLTHEWLVGGGYGQTRSRSSYIPSYLSCLFGQSTTSDDCEGEPRSLTPPDLNIVDPVYSDWEGAFLLDEAVFAVPWDKRRDYNLYVQDLITLPNGTTRLMAAIGWSRYENLGRGTIDDWRTMERGEDTRSDVEAWSPRFAIMQDIGASSTIYASYGESFQPQGSLTLNDENGELLLDPERGRQYEIGFKRDIFDEQGIVQIALFRLERENVARAANPDTCDTNVITPGDPLYCYNLLDGLQRSDGFEISVSGVLAPWWSASLGYSYLDATIVRSNDEANVGKQLPYVPEHSLTLWNRFDIFRWDDGGTLGFGAGAKLYDRVNNGFNDAGETDWNPSYVLVDTGLYYTRPLAGGQFKLSAQLKNVFDEVYYDRRRYFNSGTIVWGNERRAFLQAEMTF
ncbi:TonB-dependent siderophore receptor [Pacificimonas flava]|uniref:TonB-dependent siderophore receptor n=1 Tax=Pacificimonas flava TaxID=1234595 RepID=UPI000687A2D3|nr:TonB-dependent receptor [Pacificimonas flava]MBB5279468.1 outer membrane receptor protein involved in Fe transport [Pacificimonas flava]